MQVSSANFFIFLVPIKRRYRCPADTLATNRSESIALIGDLTLVGDLRLARFDAPQQQRKESIDPHGQLRIVPLVSVCRMMEAGHGVEDRRGGSLGVGRVK